MAQGAQKKPLDFGGNPDHITLGLGYGWGKSYPCHWVCSTWRLFSSDVQLCGIYVYTAMSLIMDGD